MNSLQQELNNINQQLEHLTFRKNQLEPIIAEYSDVIERVKWLTDNMIALNIEPTNLRFDIEDILEGNEAGEWCSETDIFSEDEPDTTPEPTPQPGQDFPSDWMQTTTEAHLQSEPTETEQPEDYDSFYPELTPEPTRQPVKMFAFIPTVPTLTQEPTPEPTPEPDPEECPKCEGDGVIESSLKDDQICSTCGGTGEKPEPEPVQINMQAYKRGDDVLIIGFSSKRLMNTWTKWFKTTWSDSVSVSNYSDNLEGFNHSLTVLWYGKRIDWQRLTKLNYSLKPTEQNAIAYHQQVSQVANSEEE